MLDRLLREPLLHFVLLGAVAFIGYSLLAERLETESGRAIVIDRHTLVSFLRNRTQQLDDATAGAAFDALSPAARRALVDEFVRSEALYREARSLGLDRGDYAIQRRLVQQMEYLLRSVTEEPAGLDSGELERHYAANKERYREPGRVTFTHAFLLPREGESEHEGRARAEKLRDRLNGAGVAFHEAPALGARFLYQVNYVQRTAEEVAADFGPEAQAELFGLPPGASAWQGPIRSRHGWHVVLLTERLPEWDPPLADVRAQVERDALRARHEKAVAAAIAEIVAGYAVRIDPALGVVR
jgi:hypothetical protein